MIRAKLRTVAASAPRVYWYVWWGTLVNRLGGFVVPLLTIYLTTQRRFAVDEAGAVVMWFGAGQVAASIHGGQLTDRLGRRATMLVSLFGGAITMVALGRARSLEDITVLVTVLGFVGELYRPAVFAFVADVVPAEGRLYAYGILYWAINLGFAVAAAVGGLVADYDFSILFYADATTTLVFAIVIALKVPETRPAVVIKPDAPSVSPLRDGQFLIFLALSLLGSIIGMQAGATLSAHMTWQGFSASTYGFVLAVNGVLIILLQPVLTRWSGRFDRSRVLAGAILLYGIAMAVHGIAPIALAHAGAVAIWTLGEILDSPTKGAVVADLAPASARGRYQGALVMTWGLAQMIGPRLGTWLWTHEGPATVWNGSLALGALVAALYFITGPALRRRLARARQVLV